MLDLLRQDLRRDRREEDGSMRAWLSHLVHPGVQAVVVYRFGRWADRVRIPVLRQLLKAAYHPLGYWSRAVLGVNVPLRAEIGPGLVVHTWGGVFLPSCRIGRNLLVQQGVVIHYDCKGIGDDVYFGPGAKVIRPVRIGSRVKIGANAVVSRDVSDDSLVLGNPGRIFPALEGAGATLGLEIVSNSGVPPEDFPQGQR